MKKLSFMVVVASCVLLAACTQPQSKLPGGQGSNQGTNQNSQQQGTPNDNSGTTPDNGNTSSDTSASSDELTAKMNVYVDCLNMQSKPVFDARGLYLKFVDPDKGPTGKEVALTVPYYGTVTTCVQNVAKVQNENPRLADLEKAGAAYVASLQKIDPLMVKAHDYYDQKDYKDDAVAKGKEMHPVLMQAWDEFEKADKELRTQVDKINNDLALKELTDLEKKDGRKVPFLVRYVLHYAQPVVDASDVGDLKDLNLENLKKTIEDFDKASTELSDYATAHPQDQNVSAASSFLSQVKGFLGASKDLMRRVRDNEPYSTGDQMMLGGATEWMVEGSPGKVVYEYNALVQSFNSLGNRLQ